MHYRFLKARFYVVDIDFGRSLKLFEFSCE